MKAEKTERGFSIIRFLDRYNAKCSLQKSSIATEDCIWFGVDDPEPKIMAKDAIAFGIDGGDGTGWVDFPIPAQVLLTTRMHLSRQQVKELLPLLECFVKTGEIA